MGREDAGGGAGQRRTRPAQEPDTRDGARGAGVGRAGGGRGRGPGGGEERRQGRVSRGPLRGRTPGPRLRLRVHAAPAPLLAGPGLTPCRVRPQRATSAKTPFPGEATF